MADKGDRADALDEDAHERRNFVKRVIQYYRESHLVKDWVELTTCFSVPLPALFCRG